MHYKVQLARDLQWGTEVKGSQGYEWIHLIIAT